MSENAASISVPRNVSFTLPPGMCSPSTLNFNPFVQAKVVKLDFDIGVRGVLV